MASSCVGGWKGGASWEGLERVGGEGAAVASTWFAYGQHRGGERECEE